MQSTTSIPKAPPFFAPEVDPHLDPLDQVMELDELEELERRALESKDASEVHNLIAEVGKKKHAPDHLAKVGEVLTSLYARAGELQAREEAPATPPAQTSLAKRCCKGTGHFLWSVITSLAKSIFYLVYQPTRSSLVPITNKGNDCWAIATLHLLQKMPALRTRIEQAIKGQSITDATVLGGLRSIVRLLNLYDRGEPINSRKIRAAFAQLTDQIDGTRPTQEDPSTVLEAIIDHLGTHYQLASTIVSHDGEHTSDPSVRPRHTIDFDLDQDKPMQDLMLRGLQTELIGENGFGFGIPGASIPSTQTFRFQTPPDQLLLQANRFKQTVVQREESEKLVLEPGTAPVKVITKEAVLRKEKVEVPIHVDQRLTLPAAFQVGASAADVPYELTRCVLHLGQDLAHGHYTTLSKTADGWEYGNDHEVSKWIESRNEWVDAEGNLSKPQLKNPQTLLNDYGYFFQYERVKTVSATRRGLSSACSKVAEVTSRTICPKKAKPA